MAARSNRFYNENGLGASIASLADIFAPPDGSDVAGWAQGAATRANAGRLADVFDAYKAGTLPPEALDRMGIGAGLFTPNQSMEAVNIGDATNRRGQDVTSGDNRYNTDSVASTSRANNAATIQGNIAIQSMQPVQQNAATPGLSPALADVFGLPAIDGFAGPVSRPTLSEAQGAAFTALPANKQADAVGSDVKISQVLDENGNPIYTTNDQAVGQTPFNASQDGVYGEYFDPTDPEKKRTITVPALLAQQNGYEAVPSKAGTTVNVGGDSSALDKKLGEGEGEQWANYLATGTKAAGNIQDFQLLDELLKIAPQGALPGRLAAAFPGFNAAGDAVQSIVKRVAPTLREPGSGSTSDIEYAGMLASLPALQNSQEGNLLINSIMQAKQDVNLKRAEVVRAYQNGELPGGQVEARQKLAEIDRISIVSPDVAKAINAIAPGTIPLTGSTAGPADDEEGLPVVSTQEEFDALPSGSEYVEDDGQKYRKP